MTYENYEILIGVDGRGIAHVLKHPHPATKDVRAEVSLTTTFTRTEKFSTEDSDTGLLQPRSATVAEGLGRLSTSARVGVDPAGIKSILNDATLLPDQWVKIDGRKVDGTAYSRVVQPLSVGSRPGMGDLPGDEYLYCRVRYGSVDEWRTFRLDGVKRAEFTEVA